MPKTATDESALWEFADRTAEQVESWPDWKKEGWAVLDKTADSLMDSYYDKNSRDNGYEAAGSYGGLNGNFD
jgi:hypothetical protein